MDTGRALECTVCFRSCAKADRYCPACGAPLTPSAVREFERQMPPARPEVSDSSRERFEKAFREQFEKRGIPIDDEQIEQAQRLLLSSRTQVRRPSVLFFDLCDSIGIERRLGSTGLHRVLGEFYDLAARVVHRHRGFVVKFMGDEVVAAFGAPVAYDRDAESCVRAAVDLLQLARHIEVGEGRKADGHAGVATGEVVSAAAKRGGARRFDILGPAANLAARLRSEANAGEILICRATALAVQNVFELRQTRPLALKGLDDPYAAFLVIRRKGAGSARRPRQTEFIGRSPQVDKIHEALRRARDGQLEIVEITGEPGVGKTRLFFEAVEAFDEKTAVHACECAPHGRDSLLLPLVEHLRRACDIGTDEPRADMAEKIERFCRQRRIRSADGEALGYLLGLPGAVETMAPLPFQTIRQRVFEALTRMVLSRQSGDLSIMCIDDAQWIDPLTVEWIKHLASQARRVGLAIVLIRRAGEEPSARLPRPTVTIRLTPLPQRFRGMLLRQIMGETYADVDLRRAVLEKAGGVPLFIEEVARLVAQIAQAKGKPSLDEVADLLQKEMPDPLYSVIQSRIDRLEQRTRDVLDRAAVLGRRFAFTVIELFDRIRDTLAAQLAVLRGLQFLEEHPAPADLEYAFIHPLAREVAYGNLPDDARRELHGEIAQRMELRLGPQLPAYYAVLSFHFERADNAGKALYYAVKSGERAASLFANREALGCYERALELAARLDEDGPALARRATILTAIGRYQQVLGNGEAAVTALEQAVEIARRLDNPRLRAKAEYELAVIHRLTGEYDSATRFAAKALETAQRQNQRALQAQCLNILGLIASDQSKFDDALAHYRAVFDLGVEAVAVGCVADARNNAGLIHWQRGDYKAALEAIGESLRLAKQMVDRNRIAAAVLNTAILQERLGRFRSARRSYENVIQLSEEIGYRQAACIAQANLANLDLIERRLRPALEHAARARDGARRIGDRRAEAVAEENLALAYLKLGYVDSSRAHFDAALRMAHRLGDLERRVSVSLGLVEWELAADAEFVSTRRVRSILRTVERHDFAEHRSRALRTLGRILARRPADRKEAERMLHDALAEANRLLNVPEQAACRECLEEMKVAPRGRPAK